MKNKKLTIESYIPDYEANCYNCKAFKKGCRLGIGTWTRQEVLNNPKYNNHGPCPKPITNEKFHSLYKEKWGKDYQSEI